MKKWLLTMLLGIGLTAPLSAAANDINELCNNTGEFAGEVLDLRKEGLSRSDAVNLVREVEAESLEGLSSEERELASALLHSVVDGVYDLTRADIATKNANEAKIFKREFVRGFAQHCRKELN